MKIVLVLLAVTALAGCKPTYVENTGEYLLPPELSDCRVYKLRDSSANTIRVVRCPRSTTTSHLMSKVTHHTTLVEVGL